MSVEAYCRHLEFILSSNDDDEETKDGMERIKPRDENNRNEVGSEHLDDLKDSDDSSDSSEDTKDYLDPIKSDKLYKKSNG